MRFLEVQCANHCPDRDIPPTANLNAHQSPRLEAYTPSAPSFSSLHVTRPALASLGSAVGESAGPSWVGLFISASPTPPTFSRSVFVASVLPIPPLLPQVRRPMTQTTAATTTTAAMIQCRRSRRGGRGRRRLVAREKRARVRGDRGVGMRGASRGQGRHYARRRGNQLRVVSAARLDG